MGYSNFKRIIKFQNQYKVLEFNDYLQNVSREEKESDRNLAEIHSKYSKIKVDGVDVSDGGGEKATVVSFNLDPIKFKLMKYKLQYIEPHTQPAESEQSSKKTQFKFSFGKLSGMTVSKAIQEMGKKEASNQFHWYVGKLKENLEKYPKNREVIDRIKEEMKKWKEGGLGSEEVEESEAPEKIKFYEEKKPNPYARPNKPNLGYFLIEYNPMLRNPWEITMESGITSENGYKRLGRVNFKVTDDRFREIILQINDYITYKESLYVRMNEARAREIEEEIFGRKEK